MTWRIGVDSGGTFTDVCLFDDETGKVEIWKVSSTPDDPSRGITQGVVEGLEQVGADASELGFLGHGTTVATNALIELRGVKTGLIVSDGFRDLLEIGRQKRPNLYDMFAEKPEQLVTRDLRRQVPERLKYDGTVDLPLDVDALRIQDHQLREGHIRGIMRLFPPVQVMETMLFEAIWVGEILLTIAIASGFFYVDNLFAQHLAHKTLLSCLAWIVFGTLLWGRHFRGWRGSNAIRWTLAGFLLLMLAYFGSKLVRAFLLAA